MNLKKTIAAGLSIALLASSGLTASAAELVPAEAQNLIIDVEAYKAAYPDLAQAFGDDTDAYVTHYLTTGVYEGRTKGVLFDPLTYTEAYSDIFYAYGYDISAIVNHYITYGITENRTMGTAHGYTNIAAAESAGLRRYYVPRYNAAPSEDNADNNIANHYTYDTSGTTNAPASSAGNTATVNIPAASAGNTALNAPAASVGNTAAANTPAVPDTNTAANSQTASIGNTPADRWQYHHTTSIYHNDGKTLWRVEYYDENNNLKEYSKVENVDTDTNSYTESIYSYNEETQTEILERTDTYVNGVLQSSVSGK